MFATKTTNRQFPAPWKSIKILGGFRIDDASGFPLAYIYENDSLVAGLTHSEAEKIAYCFAQMPTILENKHIRGGHEKHQYPLQKRYA